MERRPVDRPMLVELRHAFNIAEFAEECVGQGALLGPVVVGDADSSRLYEALLRDYEPLARPVLNTSAALRLRLRIQLIQLYDIVSLCLPFLLDCEGGGHSEREAADHEQRSHPPPLLEGRQASGGFCSRGSADRCHTECPISK